MFRSEWAVSCMCWFAFGLLLFLALNLHERRIILLLLLMLIVLFIDYMYFRLWRLGVLNWALGSIECQFMLSLSLSLCRYSISLYVYVCAHFFDWLIFSKLTNSIYFLWCLMFMDEWAWFAFSLLLLYFWTCWNDGSSWFCYTLMICICSFGD